MSLVLWFSFHLPRYWVRAIRARDSNTWRNRPSRRTTASEHQRATCISTAARTANKSLAPKRHKLQSWFTSKPSRAVRFFFVWFVSARNGRICNFQTDTRWRHFTSCVKHKSLYVSYLTGSLCIIQVFIWPGTQASFIYKQALCLPVYSTSCFIG